MRDAARIVSSVFAIVWLAYGVWCLRSPSSTAQAQTGLICSQVWLVLFWIAVIL